MSRSEYDPARTLPLTAFEPDDAPPRRPFQVTGARQTLWICTDEITEAIVHWVAPRRLGCKVAHGNGDCPFCRGNMPRKKTWWLQVCREEGACSVTELLELTANALRSEPHLVTGNGFLWGRRLTLWRYPNGPQEPMYAELDNSTTPKDLPRVKPTMVLLIRLWQAKTRAETLARWQGGKDGKSLGGDGEERKGDSGR